MKIFLNSRLTIKRIISTSHPNAKDHKRLKRKMPWWEKVSLDSGDDSHKRHPSWMSCGLLLSMAVSFWINFVVSPFFSVCHFFSRKLHPSIGGRKASWFNELLINYSIWHLYFFLVDDNWFNIWISYIKKGKTKV